MKMYKGFDKDMKCRGFQFKEGETYHEDRAKLCDSGFHACENPLDVLSYYEPGKGSIYREVELDDVTEERADGGDSKRCGKTIKIGAALDVSGLFKAHFEYVRSHTTSKKQGDDFTSVQGGNRSSVQGGNRSSVQGGNRSSVQGGECSSVQGGYGSSVQGGYGSSVQGGECSVIMTSNGKAKGGFGSLIVIAIRNEHFEIVDYCVGIVDGKKLKPDTWYTVKDGQFSEAEE